MAMSDGPDPAGQVPGERRLAHPPSERYRTTEPSMPAAPGRAGSAGRATGLSVLAAVGVAAAIVLLGGMVLVTAGLIAVAALGGWAIAITLRLAGGTSLAPTRRAFTAVALAVLAVAAGQVGLWLLARYEGGVLGPVDYLAQTFGILVPLQLAFGAGAAWLAAR